MARIIIAEDEAHIIRILSMWLQRNGHEILEARNGKMALDIARREEVDMLITDVHMPTMMGFELVEKLRTELKKNIPVMVLSSSCERGRIETTLAPHNVRVYPKPFTPSRIVAEIDDMLSAHAV